MQWRVFPARPYVADKEAFMIIIQTLNLVAFDLCKNKLPFVVHLCKLIAKIEEQMHLEATEFTRAEINEA